MSATEPQAQADAWLQTLAAATEAGDAAAAAALFAADSYWRDLVAFSWNIKTFEGRDAIATMLAATLPAARPSQWRIDGPASVADGVTQVWFTFETAAGHGRGLLRLKDGLCWTLLTTLQGLTGHEEKRGRTRPQGIVHGGIQHGPNWQERRTAEEAALGSTVQPYVVVIGGGQGGIALGARLKRLGVPAIVIEKNPRPGDSWRNRYRSLVLHDPVWYDHLPYLPFPEHWPVFAPKDQIGDWLEAYVKIMEINYWGSSEVTAARFDDAAGEWTVQVTRAGTPCTLRPKHLVFATGAYGPPNEVTPPGAETFRGEQYHSSRYQSGAPYAGKNCVVVGSNSSAHDICADLWEHDAKVTMLQRSPTLVVKSETLMQFGFKDLYSEDALAQGITTDVADLLFASMPFRLMPDGQRKMYEAIAAHDAPFYDALRRAGFLLDWGEDGSGLMMKALRTGSGYYIDVGASDLIIRGEVAVRAPVSIDRLTPEGLILSDGSQIAADLIVYATGYRSMHENAAKIISRQVADSVGPCWGIGSGVYRDPGPWQGELRNLWKPTAQPNLWFQGGNLHLSRHYSQFLALQLKARLEGIPTPVHAAPAPLTPA